MQTTASKIRREACIELMSKVLSGEIKTRDELIASLIELYEARKLSPISKHEGARKELLAVYLTGIRGLGLVEEDFHEDFKRIFEEEIKAEQAYREIASGSSIKEVLAKYFGEVDKSKLFDILRVHVYDYVLDFKDDLAEFTKIYHQALQEFPECARELKSFIKHYISVRVAKEIALRKIKNPLEKEALKNALKIRLDVKYAPPDDLVYDRAKRIFMLSDRVLARILRKTVKSSKGTEKKERAE